MAQNGSRRPTATRSTGERSRKVPSERNGSSTSQFLVDDLLRQELDELVSSMCKALNDPKRLIALYALRDGPHTVTELCSALGVPQANTSQHLAVLRERGLVATERNGNKVVYSLRHPKVLDAVDMLRDVLADEIERQQAARAPRRRVSAGAAG
jgi:DNA-binding transcriptional ArsR family regulator